MSEPLSVFQQASKLVVLLQQVERYKAYINKQTETTNSLGATDIIKDDVLTVFGAEIFQFWLASRRIRNTDKSAFLEYAASVSIPVRDRDRGPEGLSWFGRSVYDLWLEAVKED